MKVFVEQRLALPGSANNTYKSLPKTYQLLTLLPI